MESGTLAATRAAYDAVAEQYAERFGDAMREPVLDRAMMSAFAELVREARPGAVADVGCGPGHVTGHLRDLGLDVFGVDLSPQMLAIARRDHPDLTFLEGSLSSLEIEDGSLGGVLSRYSIIHLPPEELPEAFAEFGRVLAPGGHLALAFFAHEDDSQLAWAFDHKVATAYRLSIPRVAALLENAGFEQVARLVQAPGRDRVRGFHHAHLLAQRRTG